MANPRIESNPNVEQDIISFSDYLADEKVQAQVKNNIPKMLTNHDASRLLNEVDMVKDFIAIKRLFTQEILGGALQNINDAEIRAVSSQFTQKNHEELQRSIRADFSPEKITWLKNFLNNLKQKCEGDKATLTLSVDEQKEIEALSNSAKNPVFKDYLNNILKFFNKDYSFLHFKMSIHELTNILNGLVIDKFNEMAKEDTCEYFLQTDTNLTAWFTYLTVLACDELFVNGDIKPSVYKNLNLPTSDGRGALNQFKLDHLKQLKEKGDLISNNVEENFLKVKLLNSFFTNIVQNQYATCYLGTDIQAAEAENFLSNEAGETLTLYQLVSKIANSLNDKLGSETIDGNFLERKKRELDLVLANPDFNATGLREEIIKFKTKKIENSHNNIADLLLTVDDKLKKNLKQFVDSPTNLGYTARFCNNLWGEYIGSEALLRSRDDALDKIIEMNNDKNISNAELKNKLKESKEFNCWIDLVIAHSIAKLFDAEGNLRGDIYERLNQPITDKNGEVKHALDIIYKKRPSESEEDREKRINDFKWNFLNSYVMEFVSGRFAKTKINKHDPNKLPSLEAGMMEDVENFRPDILNFYVESLNDLRTSQSQITINKDFIQEMNSKLDATEPHLESNELRAGITELKLLQSIEATDDAGLKYWGRQVLNVYTKEADDPKERTEAYKVAKSAIEDPANCAKCFELAKKSMEKKTEDIKLNVENSDVKSDELNSVKQNLQDEAKRNKKVAVLLGLGSAAFIAGSIALACIFPPVIPFVAMGAALTFSSLLITTGTLGLGAVGLTLGGLSAYTGHMKFVGDKNADEISKKLENTKTTIQKLKTDIKKNAEASSRWFSLFTNDHFKNSRKQVKEQEPINLEAKNKGKEKGKEPEPKFKK